MISALKVARFLIFLKENDQRGLELSNLKLQKLLYYCQGYYLARYGKPLFEETIEAWRYGPVVPKVYFHYKSFGDLDLKVESEENDDFFQLEQEKLSVIAYVWKTLGELSAGTLVDKTHSESPWLNAWFHSDDKVISNKQIQTYFSKNISEKMLVSQ
ncbi:Panacea domain-containing protein [Peribacillus butanolivorans]|uniref:Panacea domain-containing protein n=1 Tax=Peribacillus butanolivorans TaxID=421767 RepID=UPI00366DBAFD